MLTKIFVAGTFIIMAIFMLIPTIEQLIEKRKNKQNNTDR